MDLKARIQEDVKTAMRARDKDRLGALRQLTAAIKQREIDDRAALGAAGLDDVGVLAVIDKMLKQRRESLEQYTLAGRDDLAAQERLEIEVLGGYLPAALSAAEVEAMIDAVIAGLGAESDSIGMRDMGRVMSALRPQVQGRADMGAVSAAVKARLARA
ncbi:MAG: GatB/YqeY domain-containing protein [Ectothiorhodospiraceae bacterium]|nr:GatB/YqeY domain-containing protein [Ectothiorhodospiraceae bacterium]